MNSVEVTGRLTRDPEVRYVGDGRFPVVTMNLGVENAFGRWNRESHKTEVESGFYQVEVFGDYGEQFVDLLSKGDEVYVRGSLTQWKMQREGKETERRTRIRADVVIAKSRGGVKRPTPDGPENPITDSWDDEEPF